MSNLIKKGFTWGVVGATIVWSLGIFVLPASVEGAQDGDLIKMPGNPAVYLLKGGKRYVFPNDKAYFTWYNDFSGVVTVSQSELQSYPIGGNVTYKPGTRLVKITTDPKVYAVEPNGTLRWVTTEAIATSLYGSNWNKRIDDVPDPFFVNYTTGADVTTAAYPVGSLVKEEAAATVYYIAENNTKRPFATDAALTANLMKTGNVLTATSLSSYTSGTSITGKEDALAVFGGTTTTGPAAGGTLSLALSSDTPASGTFVKNAARVPFTYINATATGGEVVIDSIVVQRGGIAQDSIFSDITILVDGTQVGLNKSFNSVHQATLYDDITVPSGTTKKIMLTGNTSAMASNSGEMPTLGLAAVTLKSGTLSASLPIYGNPMTANNTISIAAVTVARGPLDPGATSTQKIGTKQYAFTSVKLTNDSVEKVQVEEIIWDQAGSADDSDISNVNLVVDGTVIATLANPVDKKAHFKLATPFEIDKGKNKEFTIKADIDSGSNRTVDFDIEKNTDVVVKGLTYGYYVLATGWPSSTDPRLSGYAVTIDTGSLKIEPVATPSNKVADGSTGQVLGIFNFEAKGEDISITSLGIKVTVSSSAANVSDVTNITLFDEAGLAVAGPVDPSGTTSDITATSTDTITVPIGSHKYTVKGDLSTDFAAADTIIVKIKPNDTTAKGVTTGKTVTPTPTTYQTSTTQTVQAGSLVANVATTPVAATVVAGTTGYTFANYVLDAQGSGEDIRVTQIKAAQHTTGSAYPALISGLKLYDGSSELVTSNDPDPTSTTAAASATSTFTFVNALVVPKGTSKTITLKGNISKSVTSGTVKFGLQNDATNAIAATGKDTGTTITPTYSYSDGQTMTLTDAGTLTLSADASTPIAGQLPGVSTGLPVGVFSAQSRYEDINVEKIWFKLAAVNSGGPDQVDKVWLTDGTKTLGVIPTSTDSSAPVQVLFDASLDPYVVAANTTKLFTIKVDTAAIDTPSGSKGTMGQGFQFSINATGDVTAKGASSGNTVSTITGTPTFNAYTVYKTVPTVDVSSGVTNKLTANGTYELYKFTIAADPKGDVALYKLTYGISTTTVTVSSFEVRDSGYTTGAVATLSVASQNLANPTAGYLNFLFDTDSSGVAQGGEYRQIPAGSTRTFTLKGSVSGYSASQSNGVTVTLAGDADFPSTVVECAGTTTSGGNDCTGVDSDDQDDFIWSDLNYGNNSTTATNTAQWTNGYRVKGLDSTSSTAQSI
ncbi:MAG: hypothetical protein AB1352_00490 [Patescibacteria group bacterium]